MRVKTPGRWLELAFFAAGLVAALSYLVLRVPAILAKVQPIARSQQAAADQAKDEPVIPASALGGAYRSGPAYPDGAKIGTISIPALHLTAPVVEGVGDADLRRGVGHVTGSAQTGGLGNMVLAAHRDTIFRPIRDIRKGMEIDVAGEDGTFRYQVDSLEIVMPDRLDVLEISSRPEVTLITCYPFNFVGSAPKRFIVKAYLTSALPIATAN